MLHRLFLLLLSMATATAATAIDPDLLHGLEARAIGPAAVSGRIAAIDVDANDTRRIVIGAATGGVWISANAGLTWTPVFDDQPVASIGAVAMDPTNPDIIWVGTGEGNVRNSTSIGGGVFKSVDGGKTFQFLGLAGSERINRIAIDPRDSDKVYVAAMGALWGENQERGVYRTTDGGESWEKVLYVDERTGATDVKIDPHNPDRLYAAMWQFRRWPYQFKSGGPGSGLYVSSDGGETWEERTAFDGLPKGELGRMVIAPSAAQRDLVYALVEAEDSAIIRSTDGGRSWVTVNSEHDVAVRPFYYTELYADPSDPERLYNVATRVRVSIDGGKSFTYNEVIDCCAASNTIHIDNHALWINPADSNHLIVGNDGGIAITQDRGETWRYVRNLPLSQFYHVAVDNDHPYNIYGGLQDNGSWRGPSEVWENAGIRNLHWQEVGFGDGFDTVPDPRNSRQGYAMSQGGYLVRWNLDSGESRAIYPVSEDDTELRFNWNAGFAIDPFDPDTIYYGSQFLHKSTNGGETWSRISDDLTSNDPDVQLYKESGGLTYDVTAAENYTSIVAVAPSAVEQGVIWVGTDDGHVHVTRDGGQSWSRIDGRMKPAGGWVPMIHPSPHDASVAHVVVDDHRRSDMTAYVYRVSDYGKRWTLISDDTLEGYALSVLQDDEDPALLFVGTEFGLYFSTDSGDTWTRFTAGVPTVSVMDMAIQSREDDLVLGTHGRSFFVIDDYAALRGLTDEAFDEELNILSVTPGQQYDPNQTPSTRFTGSGEFRAQNEPYGVMITLMASGDDLSHPDKDAERKRLARQENKESEDDKDNKDKPGQLTVTISKGDEKLRTFKTEVKQGINRVVWGLERDGVRRPPGSRAPDPDADLPGGPEVLPGLYAVTLKLGEATATTEVEVLADPRATYAVEAHRANLDRQLELQALRSRAITALETIAGAQRDVEVVMRKIAHAGDDYSDLKKRAKDVSKALKKLEERFRVPDATTGIVYDDEKVLSRIGRVQGYLGSTYDAPNENVDRLQAVAEKSLEEAEAAVSEFVAGDLAEFAEAVTASSLGLFAINSGS